jgi:hypothetical protein
MTDDSTETRSHRPRVLKGGTIIFGPNNSEVSCTVRNQHAGGAELQVCPEARAPVEFLLYVPVDGVAYRSVVKWRRKDRIGVEILGTEPKPRFHYG